MKGDNPCADPGPLRRNHADAKLLPEGCGIRNMEATPGIEPD